MTKQEGFYYRLETELTKLIAPLYPTNIETVRIAVLVGLTVIRQHIQRSVMSEISGALKDEYTTHVTITSASHKLLDGKNLLEI